MGTEGVIRKLALYLAPVSDNVPSSLCRGQSVAYVKALQAGTSWATKMWDASAKLQAGLLTGNLNSLGNYDECINVKEVHSESGNFSGQHCLATVSFVNTSSLDAMGTLLEEVIEEEEEINIGLGALLSKGLRWGYCIPSSCKASDLTAGLSDYLKTTTSVKININDEDCSVYEDKPFSAVDWIAISIIILLFLAVLLSTGYDFAKEFMKKTRYYRRTEPLRTEPPRPTTLENPNLENPPAERPASLPLHVEAASSGGTADVEAPFPRESGETPPNPEGQAPVTQSDIDKIFNIITTDLGSPLRKPAESEKDVLGSFSLITNWKTIFSFNDSSKLLTSVDGIKFLSLCWIVLAHAAYVTQTLPAINYISVFENANHWPSVLLLNTQLAIDTFLVCTGVLISYNFFNDMKERGVQQLYFCGRVTSFQSLDFIRKYLPVYYIHRYMRLFPALAFMILLQVSLLNHAGSGPFWGTGNGYLAKVCHESWWGTLLFVQNYISGDRICLPHSWYVMVDYQLYLISPIILLMFLYIRQWKAMLTAGLMVTMGIIATFVVNYHYDLPAAMFKGGAAKWHLKTKYEYVTAYTRFAPWMIGMTVGFLLHHWRLRERNNPVLTKFMVCVGWTLALMCLCYATFGLIPYQKDHDDSNPIGRSFYSSIFHTLWALGVGWTIFACETFHGGLVHAALSQKIFQPLRHLTYCTYLVHLPLMTHRALLTRVPIHMNQATGISAFLGDLLFSLQFALILSLLVELPFRRLLKTISFNYNFPMRALPRDYEKRLSEYNDVWRSVAQYCQSLRRRGGYAPIPEEPERPEAESTDGPDAPDTEPVAGPSGLQSTEPEAGPSGLQSTEPEAGPSGLQSTEPEAGPSGQQSTEPEAGPSGEQSVELRQSRDLQAYREALQYMRLRMKKHSVDDEGNAVFHGTAFD